MHSIETINLTHRFSGNEAALSSVNLQVIENTIYGFLGPNGAGKTTTLKLILGLLKKQHGEIYLALITSVSYVLYVTKKEKG